MTETESEKQRQFGILNLGHWDLFVICYLVLGIYLQLKTVLFSQPT